MKKIRVLGVMTGTSCDGLDAACIEVDGHGDWKALWSGEAPYPTRLRKLVLEAQLPGAHRSFSAFLTLQRELGEWYGKILHRMIRHAARQGEPLPDAIANHGQTVAHFPAPRRQGMTLQAGDPTRIAYHTGLTVVASFRDGDMAAGGQGAPLAPLFHKILARELDAKAGGLSIHNIGGISNLTYIAPRGRNIVAFDTGPGNIWIDAATAQATGGAKRIDVGGRIAARGTPDLRAVEKLLKLAYFRAPAPKSTGRDDFPFALLLRATRAQGADLVATASEVTVESIARSYEQAVIRKGFPLKKVFIAGGGARNATLMTGLQRRMAGIEVKTLTEAGFDSQLLEAQAFAYFGYLGLRGQPIGGSWTGVSGFGPPGHIVPGKNWNRLLSRMASRTS